MSAHNFFFIKIIFLLKSLVDESDKREIWNVIKNGRGISCDKFFWCFYGCEKWDVEMSHLWNLKTCFKRLLPVQMDENFTKSWY